MVVVCLVVDGTGLDAPFLSLPRVSRGAPQPPPPSGWLTQHKQKQTQPAHEHQQTQQDPNAPKRAMSAFMLFSNAKRAEVKEEHPDLKARHHVGFPFHCLLECCVCVVCPLKTIMSFLLAQPTRDHTHTHTHTHKNPTTTPKKKITEISKVIGEKWKALPAEEKKVGPCVAVCFFWSHLCSRVHGWMDAPSNPVSLTPRTQPNPPTRPIPLL